MPKKRSSGKNQTVELEKDRATETRGREKRQHRRPRPVSDDDTDAMSDDDHGSDAGVGDDDTGGRSLELRRWPAFAKRILRDVFVRRLEQLLTMPKDLEGTVQTSSTRIGRVSLRDMLSEVLDETKKKVTAEQEAVGGHQTSDAPLVDPEITAENVLKVRSTRKLSVSSLPFLLRELLEHGMLRIQAQEDQNLANQLHKAFSLPVSVYVTSLEGHWAARAATEFLNKIQQIGRKEWQGTDSTGSKNSTFLNIGIVGGTTVKMIIQQLKASDNWDLDFGVNTNSWGNVRILALNVCLTRAEELPSNANVLVNELREAMERQFGRVKLGAKVEGIGLLAPLRRDTDLVQSDGEIEKVLEITDPSLIDPASSSKSQLRIVLTSIGAAKGLLQRCEADPSNDGKQSKIVGDLLYTCFDAEGETVKLKNSDGREYSLFSAVKLETLEKSVKEGKCEVMLVARKSSGGERKHVAIHSALQNHKYASCLILDLELAKDLLNRHKALLDL